MLPTVPHTTTVFSVVSPRLVSQRSRRGRSSWRHGVQYSHTAMHEKTATNALNRIRISMIAAPTRRCGWSRPVRSQPVQSQLVTHAPASPRRYLPSGPPETLAYVRFQQLARQTHSRAHDSTQQFLDHVAVPLTDLSIH